MMRQVAAHLDFPTSIALDSQGGVYVAESGLSFAGPPSVGRILRIAPDGSRVCLLDGLRAPVNGVVFHQDSLFISEGGYPGRITRLSLSSGEATSVLDGLPGFGNYHTNMAVIGPEGKLYFSQGSMTNSGIIGLDSNDLGWLRKIEHNCDIPAYDLVLTGVNAETPDPASDNGHKVITGSFAPFGKAVRPGERVAGRVPCTSAVMRCNPDGSGLEVVAWGLRNAFGLRFSPDGRLLAIECKVSNSAINSVKRLNRETVGKAERWRTHYGQQVVTAVVLSGVFKVSDLIDAQAAGVFIVWQQDLGPLKGFVCTGP